MKMANKCESSKLMGVGILGRGTLLLTDRENSKSPLH